MATATEGYVEAQAGRLRAEAQVDLAKAEVAWAEAMLRIQKDRMFFVTWIVGTGIGVAGIVIAFVAVMA